jgi:hypothetical protein
MLASFTHDIDAKLSIPGHEPVVEDLAHWVLKFALNVISAAGSTSNVPWSTHSVSAGDLEADISSERIPPQKSVPLLMENLAVLIISPWWMLKWSPVPVYGFPDRYLLYDP